MKKILYYGNCQVGAINEIMKNCLIGYKIDIIPCWLDNIDKHDFLSKIKNANIIITQPIQPNYRDTDYLHTEYILENANSNCKIIIFPSLHFDFYYFDLTYKSIDNNLLREPSDYHYKKMIDYYTNNKSIEEFKNECINNIDLISSEELEQMANSSIVELSSREEKMQIYKNIHDCFIINAAEFIKNNYKEKLLFYSMNHPSKYIFQFISENIINYLQINNNIDYNIDPLYNHERAILYKSIGKIVNFNINEHKPNLNNYRIQDVDLITKKYYEIYNKYIQLKN